MKCEHSQTLDIQFHILGYRHINRTFAAIAAATAGATGFLVNFIFSIDPAQYSIGRYVLDKNIEKCTPTGTRVIAIFRYRNVLDETCSPRCYF